MSSSWAGRLRRRRPQPLPPCLILDLPDAIVELVLSHLAPWDCGRATGACKAFHSHARGVAAVRAARYGFTLPRLLWLGPAEEPVLRMLHVVESTAGWVFEEIEPDPLEEHRSGFDAWLKLEHRPSGACLNFCATSNGWVECIRRRGSHWEVAFPNGENGSDLEVEESMVGSTNPDAARPLHDFHLLRRLSTWCDREYWNDGNWRFSLRPDGVLVSPTGRVHVDAGGIVESNLLNAQGGMVHMFWAMP